MAGGHVLMLVGVYLQAIVPRTAHHDPAIAEECRTAVRRLLISDATGQITKEAAQLVADLVKVRKCVCDPEVVRVLLAVDLSDAELANQHEKPGTAGDASHCYCLTLCK